MPKFSAPPAVAVTSPPTVFVPRFKAPPAAVTRLPVVFRLPSVSALVSAIATDPLIGVPLVVVAAVTGPTKSLAGPDRLIPPGPLRFSAVVPALEIPVPLA